MQVSRHSQAEAICGFSRECKEQCRRCQVRRSLNSLNLYTVLNLSKTASHLWASYFYRKWLYTEVSCNVLVPCMLQPIYTSEMVPEPVMRTVPLRSVNGLLVCYLGPGRLAVNV